MNAEKIVLSVALAGVAGAILGIFFATAKRGNGHKQIDHRRALFVEDGEVYFTTYVDGATELPDLPDDSALNWTDIGEASVYAWGIEDRGW